MNTTPKRTRKEKFAQQKTSGQQPLKELQKTEEKKKRVRIYLAMFVALAGFLFYANSLSNGYVLDDYGLIKNNSQTRKGVSAIPDIFKSSYRYGMNTADYSLYRPLTKAMFAAEWQLSPDKPALSHWINVLLFSLTCFVLFNFICKLFKGNLLIPFITVLLFAAHPLHTEVVANIKSRDEIVAFLLLLGMCSTFFTYVENGKARYLAFGLLLYFISLFAKESVITFIAVVPMMYYFFTNAEKGHYYKTLGGMIFLTLIFLGIRRSILGNVVVAIPIADNCLVAIKDVFLQRLNAIAILGMYLKLIVYPASLMADASFNQIPPLPYSSLKIWIPFLILAVGAVYSFLRFKKKDPAAFAVLFYFVTISITSNVVILIGTNYAERLMYVPSLGIFLLVAILFNKIFSNEAVEQSIKGTGDFLKSYSKPVIFVMVISLGFAFQTLARNKDWESDSVLYAIDSKKASNSAHMLFYLANNLSSDSHMEDLKGDSTAINADEIRSIDILTKAISIYPEYADAYQRRGYIYNSRKQSNLAEQDYLTALKYNPSHPIVFNNLGYLYFNQNKFEEAKECFEKSVKYSPTYAHPWNNLASVYGVYGDNEKRLIKEDPANSSKHAAQSRANYEQAIAYFQKAIDADNEFAEPYRLMGITYHNLGDEINADKYAALARSLKGKKGGQAN